MCSAVTVADSSDETEMCTTPVLCILLAVPTADVRVSDLKCLH